jgi:peptidoglycan pentaglycine glycine transferase (the first glycine)
VSDAPVAMASAEAGSDLAVRRATSDDRGAWDAFVAARPEGDPLQTWAWGELNEPTGERPVRVVVERANGSLAGLAQVLVRAAGMGRSVLYAPHGPIWERDAPDAAALGRLLLEGLRDLGRHERGIVVKLDPRAVPGAAERLEPVIGDLHRARHDLQAPTTRLLDLLDGGEALQATWDSDARNLVRRAEREDVTTEVVRGADPAALSAFYELLEATAERAEFRIRSMEFLTALAQAFAAGDGWYLVLARLEDRPIAAVAMPRLADRAFYLYGASLREEALKHKYGAYAALAAAMHALAEDGVRTLDLWGVAEADDPTADPAWKGFSAFKRKFGGQPLRHPGTFDLVVDTLWFRLRDLRERLRG